MAGGEGQTEHDRSCASGFVLSTLRSFPEALLTAVEMAAQRRGPLLGPRCSQGHRRVRIRGVRGAQWNPGHDVLVTPRPDPHLLHPHCVPVPQVSELCTATCHRTLEVIINAFLCSKV